MREVESLESIVSSRQSAVDSLSGGQGKKNRFDYPISSCKILQTQYDNQNETK